MNTHSQAEAPVTTQAPAFDDAIRLFYWSVRRELWESRALYLAPLAVGMLIVLGFALGLGDLPNKLQAASALDGMQQHELIEQPYTVAALLLMLTTMLVGVVYCLDALYGERRDRSVLFWKSLPVSDVMTVLAKSSIPLLVLPLVAFVVTVATQALMLLLATARLMGSGLSVWAHLSFGEMSWTLFTHLVMGHGLWYAPFWGWLLLCSAWSRRMPFLSATLPPLAVALVERIAFNTAYFGHWLLNRLGGDPQGMSSGSGPMTMSGITPSTAAQLFANPGFWFGLAITTIFLASAVRLRRSRGPI